MKQRVRGAFNMKKNSLVILLSICVVNVCQSKPLAVIECPGPSKFFHSAPGNPWVVSDGNRSWKITSTGPGDNSTLTAMNADATLKVHLSTEVRGMGISGSSCTYTLSDQTVLKVETTALNGYCPPSEESGATLGNFYEDSDEHINNSAWHRFWHSTISQTPAVSCDTKATEASSCRMSMVVTENTVGYHDCRDYY